MQKYGQKIIRQQVNINIYVTCFAIIVVQENIWIFWGSVCITGNQSIKTKKLNDRHIPYPSWHCRSLKTEKLNDRHIPYPPWHYRSLKTEKLNDQHILYPPWDSRSWPLHSSAILKMPVIKLKIKKLNHRHILYPPWNRRSLKAGELNDHYIPQQSSLLKLVSYLRSYVWIFSNLVEF